MAEGVDNPPSYEEVVAAEKRGPPSGKSDSQGSLTPQKGPGSAATGPDSISLEGGDSARYTVSPAARNTPGARERENVDADAAPGDGTTGPSPPAASAPDTGSQRHRRRRRVCIGGIVAVVLLLSGAAIGLTLLFRDSSSSTHQDTWGFGDFGEHKDCTTKPCQHGGFCVDHAGGLPFYCGCPYPYYGNRCEYAEQCDTCDIKWQSVGMATSIVNSTFDYSTYHCRVCPQNSCASEVHMISMYEPEGSNRQFRQKPEVVPEVLITVEGSSVHSPLTLVLASYEAADWLVRLPSGVIVDHVFMMSYHLPYSSVKVTDTTGNIVTTHQLHTAEQFVEYDGTCQDVNYGYGYDSNCTEIDKIMETVTSHNGCFTSFSGRYVANSWTLNLDSNIC